MNTKDVLDFSPAEAKGKLLGIIRRAEQARNIALKKVNDKNISFEALRFYNARLGILNHLFDFNRSQDVKVEYDESTHPSIKEIIDEIEKKYKLYNLEMKKASEAGASHAVELYNVGINICNSLLKFIRLPVKREEYDSPKPTPSIESAIERAYLIGVLFYENRTPDEISKILNDPDIRNKIENLKKLLL